MAPSIGVRPPSHSVAVNHGRSSLALSQLSMVPDTVVSRKVAVLVADGFNSDQYRTIVDALRTRSALHVVVSTRKGFIYSSLIPPEHRGVEQEAPRRTDPDSEVVEAQFTVHTCRSVHFDAVVILGGHDSMAALSELGETVGFVTEAFKHHKAILAADDGVQLLRHAHLCTLVNLQVVSSKGNTTMHVDQGVVTVCAGNPGSRDDAGEEDRGEVGGVTPAVSYVNESAMNNASAAAFDTAVTSFLNVLAQHRCWNRQVDRVSN